MAAAVEGAFGADVVERQVSGWVNVPADCVRTLRKIVLHAARPAGVNEPTEAGVAGAQEILKQVGELTERDLCLVLISGGGSALLPAPVPEITLHDKQAVTRFLMHAGATIHELNAVRKRLSRIKGGGLARASRAGRTVTLIISDVVGDPLDIIASGPTVTDSGSPQQALDVLKKFRAAPPAVPESIFQYLEREAVAVGLEGGPGRARAQVTGASRSAPAPATHQVSAPATGTNHIIGNNAVALAASAEKARELGYSVHSLGDGNQGEANAEGIALADLARSVRDQGQPLSPPACLLSGGEPIVHVAKTDRPRRGGRNQQLVLAALQQLWDSGLHRVVILSGGTDGEDGPTDAAGAVADATVRQAAEAAQLDPAAFLAINDSYTFFEQCGGLIKSGPTHTNVMDVRVVLVGDAS